MWGDAATQLRHALLEKGVSLRQISTYLGHESLDTTVIYTHLTNVSEARTQLALQNSTKPLGPKGAGLDPTGRSPAPALAGV